MSIGKNIKRLRESKGLTQAELGKIAGVSDKAVSTWENGSADPRMGAVQKMADYFGVKKSDILDDQDSFSSPEFSSEELRLIDYYRSLNQLGRSKLISYADDLAGNDKYIKISDSSRAAG